MSRDICVRIEKMNSMAVGELRRVMELRSIDERLFKFIDEYGTGDTIICGAFSNMKRLLIEATTFNKNADERKKALSDFTKDLTYKINREKWGI